MRSRPQGGSPTGGASRAFMVLLSVVVLVGVAGFALYRAGVIGLPTVSRGDLTRVLLVAASPDDSGAVVGQMIVVADLTTSPVELEAVSPDLTVAIPGTTYSMLGDAYSFGGGKGTAEALARARGESPLPYVSIGAQALAEVVDEAGGITVTLPAAMNVFDGTRLYAFKAGRQTLTADELRAVLKGAPYLGSGERAKLGTELADALVSVLEASSDALTAADTDIDADGLARLEAALSTSVR